ncbi:MAG TPA: thiamine pyrophosphate-dependent enzyme [Candidatus Angelobacter sp.]
MTPSRRKAKRAKNKPSKTAASRNKKNKTIVAAVLDSQKLQDLYAAMLRAHLLQKWAKDILPASQEESSQLENGREAVLAGAIAHMLPGDSLAAVQDEFLASFVRGLPLTSIVEQIVAGDSQPSAGTERNRTRTHALNTLQRGVALGVESKGKPLAVLCYFGEHASAAYDTLNLAAKDKLPLVCVAEAKLSGAEDQNASASSAHGARNFPQITVDGNDVVAIFRVAQEAVRRARSGHGPSLIECLFSEEKSAPGRTDQSPGTLAFMQAYLQRRSLWSDEWQQKIVREFQQELDAAIANAPNAHGKLDRVSAPDRSSTRSPQRLELS